MGIYVHFPWCLRKCGYCDFFSVAAEGDDGICHARYADQVLAELERRMAMLAPHRLTTVFIGGGTPSLWEPAAIQRVVAGILGRFGARARDVEITVECNPSSFDERTAEGMLEAQVNRISLGVQSLDDQSLQFLGRQHDRKRALEAVALALRSGFQSVSADLLFGLPQQTTEYETAQVLEVAAMGVAHLSVYGLTIEDNTPFGRRKSQGTLPLACDERVAESFLAVDSALVAQGFSHYEISNFARAGYECLHNQQYWWGTPYLGLGAAAFGTVPLGDDWIRYKNPANIESYLLSAFECATFNPFARTPHGGLEELEILDSNMRVQERILLGLRLACGLDLAALSQELGVQVLTPRRQKSITRQVSRGNLVQTGSRIHIEPQAWLLSDSTILDIA